MIFEKIVVGPLQCNCIILGCEETREALVVDPGDEVERILGLLERHRLRVKVILQTHAHFDHVGATKPLRDITGARVCLHRDDQPLYENLPMQVAMFGLKAPEPTEIQHWYRDGEEISAGTVAVRVMHTPGHSPGSVSFHLPPGEIAGAGILLSGDTLFAGGIGRTDLWGGSYEQIIESIRERLLVHPDNTAVHPGHSPDTTIGLEKDRNPFLQGYF